MDCTSSNWRESTLVLQLISRETMRFFETFDWKRSDIILLQQRAILVIPWHTGAEWKWKKRPKTNRVTVGSQNCWKTISLWFEIKMWCLMRASIVRQIPLWDLIGRLWRRRWPRMWTRSWDAWWWHCPVIHCEGCFPLSLWFPDYGHIVNTSMPLLLSKEGIVCKRMQTKIQVKYRCKYLQSRIQSQIRIQADYWYLYF